MLEITPLYASALAILFLVLTVAVILRRGATKVSLQCGDDRSLIQRVRRHGNFTETVPLALLLLAMLELNGLTAGWVHTAGGMLLLGRVLHPLGIDTERAAHPLRIIGMGLTILMIAGSALYLLFSAIG
ncbi:MAG: MAPEG family protein [Granulosicoccus sp.]|nr:MAPEG family protein [Granulosicoccus sp.]